MKGILRKFWKDVVASLFGERDSSNRGGTSAFGNSSGNMQRSHPAEPEMVFVQGGTFRMGCTGEQQGCEDNEKPVHEVTVSSFYMGKYEVTQAQWETLMGSNPSRFKGGNLPVEKVSWDNAQMFIERLNAATGKQYRLPTEAEWEYAARGGTQSRGYQYSGSNTPDDVAWYYDNLECKAHPVGTKMANELGIYDMSGNVWEWCYDWYGPVSYWRTSSGFEVDFVLGDHQVAIEVKSINNVNPRHLKGLRAFAEEYTIEKQMVVSNDPYPRLVDNILILPWKVFLQRLWNGEII